MRDDNDFRHMTERAVDTVAGTRSSRRNTALIGAGVALAAAALYVQRRSRQAERDNPPQGQFIEVEGVRLHYIERGEGPPLVLLHGDGSMIQDFVASGLVERAAQRYRVIVFDRPGYGYSERPRTTVWTPQAQAELLHHALHLLGVRQAIVLGHSWGTLVAISMALANPGFVKSLILLSGYYYPTARLDVPLLSPPAIPVIGDLMRFTISPLLGRLMWPALMRRIFSPAPMPERFEREFQPWMALRPSQLRASAGDAALMIPATFSLRDRYRELSMPVAIMAGAGDKYVNTHTQSERLHDALQQSTLHVTDGAGHMLHQFAPDEVLRVIDSTAEDSRAAQRIAATTHVRPPVLH